MKNIFVVMVIFVTACTHLTTYEQERLQELNYSGVSVDQPQAQWEKPANPVAAGALNLLPGFGNFYLAAGNGAESSHYLYGFLNLITWPLSIIWGVPEAMIDAGTLNQRDLLYYYRFKATVAS